MPLSFNSLNYGSIAFGFFNIDTDMLLLDRYFFFSTEFCEHLSCIVESDWEGPFKAFWQVYYIGDPEDIGDLTGAIYGVHFQGFIGELYRQFPFPNDPENFKQQPEGVKNRAIVEYMVAKYAMHIEIPFVVQADAQEVEIGVYKFNRKSFQELVTYVWRGGFPRWKDDIRPAYVQAMKNAIEQHPKRIFKGIFFGH